MNVSLGVLSILKIDGSNNSRIAETAIEKTTAIVNDVDIVLSTLFLSLAPIACETRIATPFVDPIAMEQRIRTIGVELVSAA